MPEVVPCPTCGAPAEANRPAADPGAAPILTALSGQEAAEKITQLHEVIRVQREQLDVAQARVRDLEELLRSGGFPRPGVPPPAAPPATPGFPRTPFQGKAGAW